MSTETPRIVGIGAVFVDDIVLSNGQTYMAQLGGGVVHALMGAAIWGERPGINALVGQGLPNEVYTRLGKHFDIRGLTALDILQIRAWQIFEEDGTRRELYRVQDTASFIRGPQPEHLPDSFHDAQGYYLLQGFEGIRTWCDTLSGFVLWEPLQQVMVEGSRTEFRKVLQECRIDLVSPNLVEAQAIYGELPPDELINALFEDGARVVALRMGEKGSIVACRETGERYYLKAVRVPEVIDQTGAGNTYCGGLLWGIVEGRTLRDAGAAGTVSASFCLEQVGVLDPDRVEIVERDWRYAALKVT
jgi:pfkB family carbohydrate kinase